MMKNNTQPVPDPDRKFSKADYDFICSFRKVTHPNQQQMDEVLKLYRKYVQYVYGYTTNCNCSTGIWNLWNTLNDYVANNDSLFEH